MENFLLFQQIRSIHAPLAGLTFLLVIISDMYGALWIMAKKDFLNLKVLHFLHRIVFVGLGGLIITGLGLIYLDNSYLQNYIFLAKMFFVTVLFVNAFRIGKEVSIPANRKFIDLTYSEKKHMILVGATSIISWVSVLFLATML